MDVIVSKSVWNYHLHEGLAAVPQWRREQAMSYRRETDMRQCVLAYLLLQRALRRYGVDEPPVFDRLAHGKPVLRGHEYLHFNLSHCERGVVCALGRVPVGVDVEAVRPVDEDVMRRVLSPEELHRVGRSADPSQDFARLWTRKESFLKLTGEGLVDDLPGLDTGSASIITRDCYSFPDGGFVLSLATSAPVTTFSFEMVDNPLLENVNTQ